MGWFQTLFVYLHAMPRATVRRIWDWWLASGDFEVSKLHARLLYRTSFIVVFRLLCTCPALVACSSRLLELSCFFFGGGGGYFSVPLFSCSL